MNFERLDIAWKISLALSMGCFLTALYIFDQFSNPELVSIVIIFASCSILFSALFFLSSTLIAPQLKQFIKDDQTKVQGPTVIMETTVLESGNDAIDKWVSRYVFARNTFGLAIIPLLILAGLFIFA